MLPYPPRELWPERIYSLPELSYPDTMNACHELLDANIALGRGSTPAIYFGNSIISYDQLFEDVIRIAGALRRRRRGGGTGPAAKPPYVSIAPPVVGGAIQPPAYFSETSKSLLTARTIERASLIHRRRITCTSSSESTSP